MRIDLRTMMLCITAGNLLMGVVLFTYWRVRRTYPGFGSWTASTWLIALAFFLFGLRGSVPESISVVCANACGFVALGLRLHGIRRFFGNSPGAAGLVGTVVLATVVLAATLATPLGVEVRVALVSSLVAGFSVLIGRAFVAGANGRTTALAWLAFGLYLSYAVAFLVRGVAWLLAPEARDFLVSTPADTAFYFAELALDLAVPVVFLALNAERLADELEESQNRLRVLASTDPLTGVLNRRAFLERLESERARASRLSTPLSVLMVDIDRFKRVNDTFGHAAGDEALRHVARVLAAELRVIDSLGRVGGEEFAALLPGTDLEGAELAGERLRRAVEASPPAFEGESLELTVSAGVAERVRSDSTTDALLRRADAALYEAKAAGRNRVRVGPARGD